MSDEGDSGEDKSEVLEHEAPAVLFRSGNDPPPALLRSLAGVTAFQEDTLDALDAAGWLVQPPCPSDLVRAASADAACDGAMEF